MEIIRENKYIVIQEKEIIEKYSLDEEINFKKLIEYLLNKNLKEKIECYDKVEQKNNSEENLIRIIKKLIDNYNDKVEELINFKEIYNSSNSDNL